MSTKAKDKLRALSTKNKNSKGKTKGKGAPRPAKVKGAPRPAKTKSDATPKKQGVGAYCKDLILAGKTNDQVLSAVQKKFPTAKTSVNSINWYRHDLRKDGKKVKTARELKTKAA